jgi:DNA-directed RNA polymerase subunit RPC12/RpoP
MAALKTKLGRIPCSECGHPVLVKENDAGTLTVQCDECDVSSFAKKGTGAAARWRAKLAAAGHVPAPPVSVPKADDPAPVRAPPPPPPKAKTAPYDPLAFLGGKKA